MLSFFEVAKPLQKGEFIESYKQTVTVSQLFLAPFGLPEEIAPALGGNEEAVEYVTNAYKMWEDCVSRKLYSAMGISDERVAASIYFYAEEIKDEDVVEFIQRTQASIGEIIFRKKITELPHLIVPESEFPERDRDAIIVRVMRKVISALQTIFGCSVTDDDSSSSGLLSSTHAYDSEMMHVYGIRCPVRVMNSGELSFLSAKDKSFMNISGLKMLYAAFAIDENQSLSIEQYYALIDLSANSPEMTELLREYGLPPGFTGLNALRSGMGFCEGDNSKSPAIPAILVDQSISIALQILDGSEIATIPRCAIEQTFSKINSLRSVTDKLTKSVDMASLQDCGSEEEMVEMMETRQGEIVAHLSLLDAGIAGDYSALCEDKDRDEDEVEDEVEDEEKLVHKVSMPAYVRALLIADRADCLFEMGEIEEALGECNRSIELSPRVSKAYALRAKISIVAGTNNTGASTSVVDALTAFLLGGSVDLTLAALAEEAAKESCRFEAQSIFKERQEKKFMVSDPCSTVDDTEDISDLGGCNASSTLFPRIWFINAYFEGYMPLDQALGIDMDLASEEMLLAELRMDGSDLNSTTLPSPPEELLVLESALCSSERGVEVNRQAYHILRLLIDELLSVCDMPASSTSQDYETVKVEVLQASSMSAVADSLVGGLRYTSGPEFFACQGKLEKRNEQVPAQEQALYPNDLAKINKLKELQCVLTGACGDVKICETSTHDDTIVDDEHHKVFQSILSALQEPGVSELLGVTVGRDGNIKHFGPYISELIKQQVKLEEDGSLSKSNKIDVEIEDEDEEVWEDCDDDDDDDDDDEESDKALDTNSIEEVLSVPVEGSGDISEISDVEAPRETAKYVSQKLLARLLNAVSSIAFLAGDGAGCLGCLRASVALDPKLLDSTIKLSSMFAEMDDLENAFNYMSLLSSSFKDDAVFMLHQAEVLIHKNKFEAAAKLLKKAQGIFHTGKYSQSSDDHADSGDSSVLTRYNFRYRYRAYSFDAARAPVPMTANQMNRLRDEEKIALSKWKSAKNLQARTRLSANICSLLGVSLFRANPNEPQASFITIIALYICVDLLYLVRCIILHPMTGIVMNNFRL